MAHAVIARPRTRLDGKNRQREALDSNKLTFPDEPTSDELTSSTRVTSTSINQVGREGEKPRHSDSRQDGGQKWDGGQELDGRQDGGMVGRSWIAGRSSMAGRMAGWWAEAG